MPPGDDDKGLFVLPRLLASWTTFASTRTSTSITLRLCTVHEDVCPMRVLASPDHGAHIKVLYVCGVPYFLLIQNLHRLLILPPLQAAQLPVLVFQRRKTYHEYRLVLHVG